MVIGMIVRVRFVSIAIRVHLHLPKPVLDFAVIVMGLNNDLNGNKNEILVT
jgi:hypothetical protein